MKKNHIAIFSAFAAFILLASVFLAPVKMQSSEHKFSHGEQLYCTVAVSSTLTLAETKPRMDNFDATSLLSIRISPLLFAERSVNSIHVNEKLAVIQPVPLWLMNRSLLI
ncbi:MAG: hypothetical protein C0469_08645 [Cyanobacteria bacterium DS2.3.42]|nr:hypothetical protein [Cyanobacteria bacterium DS2.3.42]